MRTVTNRRVTPRKPYVFLGHGHCQEWTAVGFHLQQLGLKVKSYDIEPGVGGTINENIANLVKGASAGILLMTADDKLDDGTWVPRDNVIHESGLCQGKLGLKRMIVLKEDRVQLCTNLAGVVYIEFTAGNIQSTFPQVEAALKKMRLGTRPRTA